MNINFREINTKLLSDYQKKVYWRLYNTVANVPYVLKEFCKEYKQSKLEDIITLVVHSQITLFDEYTFDNKLLKELIKPCKEFITFKRKVLYEETYQYLKRLYKNLTFEKIKQIKGIEYLLKK